MQYDTNLSFGEIHNSPEALVESIEQIIDTALVKVSDDEPLKLRFITPSIPLGEWLEDENCANYEITPPDQHFSGMQYVAVSYCWAHDQSKEGLPLLPNYYIHDPQHTSSAPRRNRCPDLVLYRAIAFARKKKCPYIWIDQECINQFDKVDVEKHLQVMHRVYSESCFPVAVLAKALPDDETASFLLSRLGRTCDVSEWPEVVKILQIIGKDQWFKRTWALQERECSKDMTLLLPRSHILNDGKFASRHVEELDFQIRIPSIQFYLFGGMDRYINRPREAYSMMFLYGKEGNWDESSKKDFSFAYIKTDRCDNLVVSDRVAILGNICDLPYRLLSNRLCDVKYSYSTCAFALFLANVYQTREKRAEFIKQNSRLLLRGALRLNLDFGSFYS